MSMTLAELPIGTRVFNNGDMANESHFGTITDHKPAGRFSAQVEITPDEGSDRSGPYWIMPGAFSKAYDGTGLTRFVTEAAYKAWRQERLATMEAEYKRVMAKA